MRARDDAPLEGFEGFDKIDPKLRREYQERLDARLGATWPLGRKGRYRLLGAVGFVGFLVAGSLSLTEPATTPMPTRALLGLLALVSLGWSAFAMRSLARRTGDFADERLLASRIAVVFSLAALLALGLAASALQREAAAQPMLIATLGLVVVAACGSIGARVDRAELSLREQLLRLEVRVAALQDRPPA